MTPEEVDKADRIKPGDTIGAIDCGSNAIRFSLYTFTDEPGLPDPQRHRFPVRLGSGTFNDGNLAEGDIDAAVEAFHKIAAIAKDHNVVALPAVATSAIREAGNSKEFLKRVQNETGIKMRAISGKEEARLVASGVNALYELETDGLIIDIGGGSTEIIHCDRHGKIIRAKSVPLGAVRLAQMPDRSELQTGVDSLDMEWEASYEIKKAMSRFKHLPPVHFTGVGGTVSTLVNAARFRKLIKNDRLEFTALEKLIKGLEERPASEYPVYAGIPEDRTSIILPGAIILRALMLEVRIVDIQLSDAGLREGLVQDYLNRRT